jgi:glycosyltransferase involved in cell wall biosynthesis
MPNTSELNATARGSHSVSMPGKILVVDHTSLPGGAELALPRIARHSTSNLRFLFLEPNFAALEFPSGADITGPQDEIGVLQQMRLLRLHLRSGQYVAVVSNTLRASVYTALVNRSVPHIMYLQDGADRRSLSSVKRMLLRGIVLPRLSKIFPNSHWTAKSLGVKYADKVSSPVFSPSGGRETDLPPARHERFNESPLRLLSLSRVVEWKGLHIVIEALSLLATCYESSSISLTVAGGNLMGPDSYMQDLIVQAKRLPFDVKFIGHQGDINELLESHDVLMHASIRPEPFGQVIVQGLAARLAVIASNAGGPAEIIQHRQSGLLHKAGDAKDLAAQLDLLLREPELRRALQDAGPKRADAFSDSAVVARFDRELAAIVEEHPNPGSGASSH